MTHKHKWIKTSRLEKIGQITNEYAVFHCERCCETKQIWLGAKNVSESKIIII